MALVAAVAVAAAGVALLAADSSRVGDPGDDPGAALRGSSCEKLAAVAALLAQQDLAPRQFLREIGRRVAGIRPPPRGILDLAGGGRNVIAGRGFRRRYDDGSAGQARHFAGIAVATTYGGGDPTRWISENLRRDPAGSPDGLLTEEGIAFAIGILDGRIPPAASSGWLHRRLCRPPEVDLGLGF